MKKLLYIVTFIILIISFGQIKSYTKYKIGDIVPYNGVNYYVIKDSETTDATVTLLKAEPLTVDEVNLYGGVDTANNHVNMYNTDSSYPYYRTASDYKYDGTVGGMAYYTSVNCGYGQDSNHTESGCTTDYGESEIKYVVDAWKIAQAPAALEARLITKQEIDDNFEFEEFYLECGGCGFKGKRPSFSWLYNSNYWYWTCSGETELSSWYVRNDGTFGGDTVTDYYGAVRPVVVLSKVTLGDEDESIVDEKNDDDKNNNNSELDNKDKSNNTDIKSTDKVENTYMRNSIVIILLGLVIASISVFVFYKIRNKEK